MFKKIILVLAVALLFAGLISVHAQEQTISINSGTGSEVWFISGEPSLVINGFDLNALGVPLPAVINRVSISVDRPTPGVPVEVVIYQDANGGSPVDAVLVGRTQVDITSAGVFTVTLPEPVTVTQPAVWIGFYLPVDFRFLGDTSGSSVLTYWAWTPGGTFDLANLASAQVLGPADGSAPVNINMNGRARITAGITSTTAAAAGAGIVQTEGSGDVNLGVLASFAECENVLYDTADELSSYLNAINVHCDTVPVWLAPPSPPGFERRGGLYDLQFYKDFGILPGRLTIAVTHCIRPAPEDLNRAVIGLAHGAPREWRILPSQRFGDLVCAEVRFGGNLSYFVPFGS